MIEYATNREHKCVVYMAINLKTDDIYIGATEKGVRQRQLRHLWNARNGRPGKLYNAIRKYGENNFLFVEHLKCVDFWDALKQEEFYIKAMRPKYNLTAGGGGVKGYKFSEESKQRMAAAKRGKPGRITHSRPVKCLTDNREFISVSAAAKHYNLDRSTVAGYCGGSLKPKRLGLRFEYIALGGSYL